MAVKKGDFDLEDDTCERENTVIVQKIAVILQKIVDALKDTDIDCEVQNPFACKEMPNITFSDLLSRFQTYGDVRTNFLLAALIFTDRALKTRMFTKKSTIHK